MKILIFSWRGPKHPHAGGAEISTHEHTKGWVRGGHDVTLFTSTFAGCKKEETADGVRIIRRGGQVFGVQWAAFSWYLFGDHPKFDLIVDQFHGIPFFTPLYVKEKKLAFIHELTKEVWKLNPWSWPFNKLAAFFGEIFEPLIFKLLYKEIPFMTVSESTRNDLIEWGISKDQITIIHNGINIPKTIRLFTKRKDKAAIFLGAVSRDKGIEEALEIFARIYQHEKDWRFWIVGSVQSNYLDKLRKQSEKLGINKRVKFLGFVSEVKKFELLSRARIAINPSIREGWGLVVIEAASVGTPTVGYNVAGLKDSIINGSTGILCDPNPFECSRAILSLISNKKDYSRFRKNCIKWSKNFSWEKTYKESLKLINEVYEKG